MDELLRQREMWKRPRKLFVWSVSRGFVDLEGRPAAKDDTRRPERALAFVAGYPEGALFLFKDFHPYLKDNVPDAALLIRRQQGLTGADVKAILEEKEQIIRKSGILEYTAAVRPRATGPRS